MILKDYNKEKIFDKLRCPHHTVHKDWCYCSKHCCELHGKHKLKGTEELIEYINHKCPLCNDEVLNE